MRCGIMAPVLRDQFRHILQLRGFSSAGEPGLVDGLDHANIASISHIGGHKYAGNVIIYIPPNMTIHTNDSATPSLNPLAGKGIWYGRVEPKHVEGIVEETILGGKVVEDHFRGAIGQNGEVLRL